MGGGRLALVGAAWLAGWMACADLAPIELGICGNGVLDVGEDCDTYGDASLGEGLRCGEAASSPPERSCRYLCDPAACPLGWGCGADGICRQPSEALRPGVVLGGWVPDSFATIDFDGDGLIDLVGSFEESVEFRLGEATGFGSPYPIRTPPIAGDVETADLDGDPYGDATVPSTQGALVWRGRPEGAPLMAAWAGVAVPDRDFVLIPTASADFEGANLVILLGESEDGVEVEPFAPDARSLAPPALLWGAKLADLRDGVVDADLDHDPHTVHLVIGIRDRSELAVLLFARHPLSRTFEILRQPALDIGAPCAERACTSQLHDVRIAAGATAADVDGDDDVDLLVSVRRDDGADAVVVLSNAGDASFAPAYVDDRFDLLAQDGGASEREAPRWPLLAVDLDGDRAADFVSPDGVYRSLLDVAVPVGLERTFARPTQTPWTSARPLDVDGDGLTDIAAIAAGERAVHFLQCSQGDEDCRSGGRFRHVPVPTSRGVAMLATGLLRGLPTADTVVVERQVDPAADDVISVIHGELQRGAGDVVEQSVVHRVERIDVGDAFALGDWSADAFQDVLLSIRDPPATTAYGVLHGAPGERLTSPFHLPNGEVSGSPGRGAGGRVVLPADLSGRGAPFADLAFLGSTTSGRPFAYWAAGRERAALRPIERGISLHRSLGEAFELDCAASRAGDVDGDGRDELVILWGAALCPDRLGAPPSSLALGRAGAEGELTFEVRGASLPASAGRAILEVADVDGDGADDVLIAAPGGLHVLAGGPGGPAAEPRSIPLPAEDVPTDVALLADGAPSGPRRVAVLTTSSLTIVSIEGGPRTNPAIGGRRLRSADLDTDGLGDLLVLAEDGLHVHHTTTAAPLGGEP